MQISFSLSKTDTIDLLKFLEPFTKEIQDIALELRKFVWDLYPDTNELIYDNYNAVAFGWSPSDIVGETFCSIAVGSNKYIHFGFYWGSKIEDPKKILQGKGNQYRFIRVKTIADFPADYMKLLIQKAYVYSISIMKDPSMKLQGKTIVKSISEKKKRPK